jgi:hypothetical protein
MSFYTVNGNIGYRIVMSNSDFDLLDSYLPAFEKMIDSFQTLRASEPK